MKALTTGWQERKEVSKCRMCSERKSNVVSQTSVRERQEGESGAQVDQVLPIGAVSPALCVKHGKRALSHVDKENRAISGISEVRVSQEVGNLFLEAAVKI